MLPGLEFVQSEGLRVSESPACRVRLGAELLDKNSPVIAVVDGVEVEVRGKHRRSFRRALVKLIEAHERGRDGIPLHELGKDQGAVSGIRKSDSLWKSVISTPGDRYDGTGLYFIRPAQTASYQS
jgi:hypothetical protein